LRKTDHLAPFLAGVGIGVAASLLLAPQAGGDIRHRIQDIARRVGHGLKEGVEKLCDDATDVLRGLTMTGSRAEVGGGKTMKDMKDKAKEKIADAAEGVRKAADKVVEKSKNIAHGAGKKMEEGGKRLQDA
jgi:gas vesicle protein